MQGYKWQAGHSWVWDFGTLWAEMGTYFVGGIGVVGDIGVQGNFVGGMRGRILD